MGRVRRAAASASIRLQPDARLPGGRGDRGRRRRGRRRRAQPHLRHRGRDRSPSTGNSGTGNGGTGTGGTGNGGAGSGGFGNGGTGNGGTGNGFGGFPSGTGNGGTGNSGTGGTNTGTGSLNATALAAKVDPGLVDVTSTLKYSDATAEGTGMVLTSSGLVLTNNHVIDEATSVSATLVVSGKTYTAQVVGYDDTDDVALLQLVGASGLKTVTLGNSTNVKVDEAVLALGNAGGAGGLPSTAQGTIQGLDKSIQASDEGAGTTENLSGMLETDAPIEEGDSGGPLVNGSGQVVGMDTAAYSSEGGQERGGHPGLRDPDQQGRLHRRRDKGGAGVDHRAPRPGGLHGRQRGRRR